MAIIKCEVCGGELELNADMSVGVCKYCEAVNVISKNLDRIGNLFNRAIFLRQNKEFDKAMDVYEEILKEDNSDSKAHWGFVLSKYGIEYVQDNRTGKYLPTCHRMQKESLLSDPDYLAAIENADFEGKRVYEEDAKRINEIHARILEISTKEPSYDVFICYKETDDYGRRTEDSIIAQDIYYELEKKSYKVFFARKTLESKLGSEYEPIIFAALNSAKVMVVVGTKSEYFNAVWVKNEWGRFCKMSKNAEKVIIPVYKGISPYELPIELANFQALDMSKIGFIQDLLDGIERCTRRFQNDVTFKNAGTFTRIQEVKSLERLLQMGETYLKLDDYVEASKIYTTITKEYPEDYRGWWGVITSKINIYNIDDKKEIFKAFEYVKRLIEKKEYKKIESQYIIFLRKIAEKDVVNEVQNVRESVKSNKNAINDLEKRYCQERNRLKDNIKKSDESYENKIKNCEDKIEKEKIELDEYDRNSVLNNGKKTFIGLFLCLTFILLPIGIYMIISSMSSKEKDSEEIDIEKRILETQEEILKLEKEREENRNYNTLRIEQFDKEYKKKNSEKIKDLQQKIDAGNTFCNLKQEEIEEYCFYINCKENGIEQKIDEKILTYHDIALGKLSIKSLLEEQLSELRLEQQYEICCPICSRNFLINEATFKTGYARCTNCGVEIELLPVE